MRKDFGAPAETLAGADPAARAAGEELLHWYRRHRRDLAWRRTTDPWAILVSEVMLQQTRVEHVEPYFLRFLARFPTVTTLAAAPLDEVLAAWSGLGYYRRARALHQAAHRLAGAGGVVPADPRALRRLPGVGEYTAAAVASIAFGVPVAALDGNGERVLCRWLGCAEEPRRVAVRRRLHAAASALLVAEAAGESNQALIELGARICTPQGPRCGACPLAGGCAARQRGIAEHLPQRRSRPASRQERWVMVRLERAGRILLCRRSDPAPLPAGTWELPWVALAATAGRDGGLGGTARRGGVERRLGERYGLALRLGEQVGRLRHAITIRRIEARVFTARLAGAETVAEASASCEVGWFAGAELAVVPQSSLVRKALAAGGQVGAGGAAAPPPPTTAPRGSTDRRRRG